MTLSAGLATAMLFHCHTVSGTETIPGNAACPPSGHDRQDLLSLRDTGFSVPDEADRNALAVALLGCLDDPDPAIRDGVVYEGLASWLRAGAVSEETRKTLLAGLLGQLERPDAAGFRQPFAALLLSEVARTDRIEPWLAAEVRQRLVDAAASYLASIGDYRGFSDTEGWRHGVAHGADFALQLALNPAVGETQLAQLLDAVASQIAPPGEVFYVYGEPARLARPVLFAHQRAVLAPEWWDRWFARVTAPEPFASWDDTWTSNAGLAKRHNLLAFLSALHLNVTGGAGPADAALKSRVEHAIQAVSGG